MQREEKIRLLELLLVCSRLWIGKDPKREYRDNGLVRGFCDVTSAMATKGFITEEEERWIDGYIRKHNNMGKVSGFIWEESKRKPRFKWLASEIQRQKEKANKNRRRKRKSAQNCKLS